MCMSLSVLSHHLHHSVLLLFFHPPLRLVSHPLHLLITLCSHLHPLTSPRTFNSLTSSPNGENCKYRHALPPGFVLDSDKKKKEAAAKANVITLEEFLESERHKLGKDLTPVTAESFAIWKKTRMDKKMAEDEVKAKLKEGSANSGKLTGLSGRDLVSAHMSFWLCRCVQEEERLLTWSIHLPSSLPTLPSPSFEPSNSSPSTPTGSSATKTRTTAKPTATSGTSPSSSAKTRTTRTPMGRRLSRTVSRRRRRARVSREA
jgi:hypothetical protein